MKPTYLYRHKTDKPIYKITDGDMCVECTEDHSLFTKGRKEIKPSELTQETELEYYTEPIVGDRTVFLTEDEIEDIACEVAENKSSFGVIPESVLNTSDENKKLFNLLFINEMQKRKRNLKTYSKAIQAGLQYLK